VLNTFAPSVARQDIPPPCPDSAGAAARRRGTHWPVRWQSDVTGPDRAGTYKHRGEGGTFVSPAMHRQYRDIEASDGTVYTTTRTHGITPETETTTHVTQRKGFP